MGDVWPWRKGESVQAARRAVVAALVTVVWLVVTGASSHAVVHEIVGQWCSGRGELMPPGIADPTSQTFARPLEAMGFVGEPVFRADLGGLLIPFNFDEPASKVVGTGEFVQIGALPDGTPVFIEQIALDPDHPAFQHCPRLFSP